MPFVLEHLAIVEYSELFLAKNMACNGATFGSVTFIVNVDIRYFVVYSLYQHTSIYAFVTHIHTHISFFTRLRLLFLCELNCFFIIIIYIRPVL